MDLVIKCPAALVIERSYIGIIHGPSLQKSAPAIVCNMDIAPWYFSMMDLFLIFRSGRPGQVEIEER